MPYILVLLYLGVTIYAANQVQIGLWRPAVLTVLLYIGVGLMAMMSLFPLQIALLSNAGLTPAESADIATPQVALPAALAAAVFGFLLTSFSGALVSSQAVRARLAGLLNREPHIRFDPDSPVHLTAWLLSSLIVVGTVFVFILSGGIAAVAESVAVDGIDPFDTMITGMLELIAAALGVGYALRRDGAQTLQRLGLRIPTRQDISAGVLTGIGLIIAQIVFVTLTQLVLDPQSLAEQSQAAQQITLAVSTLPMVLILSLSAAIGEETLIRGALQPVLGTVISSAFFTLLHSQYLGTPFMLLIFAVSLAFAWLRRRYSTTAAIIAHFTYNFFPLFLLMLATTTGGIPN